MSVPPQLGPPGERLSERARWHLGGLLTIRAAAGDTNGAIAVVEERAVRGYATPAHVHGREDETLFVIDGTLQYTVDGVTATAAPGEAVHLPKGLAHRFEVTSDEAHFLVIITPGGFEEFFTEVSPPAADERVPDHSHTDPAHMVRAAAARGTTVFRGNENDVLAAAMTVAESDSGPEIVLAYGELGAALVEPMPAVTGEITNMLVDAVVERLPTDPVHARALILLGILVERTGAHCDVPRLLQVVGPDLDDAAVLAFAYLLAHFPAHGTAVLDAMSATTLAEEDRERLARCLAQPDLAEMTRRLGRVWPSPAVWRLDTDERQLDEAWRADLRLDAETAGQLWEAETVALLAYMGARADHAVERVKARSISSRQALVSATTRPRPSLVPRNMLDLLDERYRDVFACPTCLSPVTQLTCANCDQDFRSAAGYPDFAPEVRMKPGLGPFYLQDPLHVTRYEAETRVAFLNVMGANWDNDLTPTDEDEYLRARLEPVDGPVLDLACGAGRWTRTVMAHVGSARVIGLDLSTAMIDLVRAELPSLCVVRGTALRLPFTTGSLGAVNCSNALQLLPDPRTVIQEIGRCLRPGGTFTAFTFRQAERPAYRHFQRRHEKTFNVRAFRVDELVSWTMSAGLEITDLRSPAETLLFTARRTRS